MGTLTLPLRVALPSTVAAGEVVSLRLLLQHPMETGYRLGEDGARIPRQIIQSLRVYYADRCLADLTLQPAISANPYFAFSFIADRSGPVRIEIQDDQERQLTDVRELTVVP